MGNPDIRKKSRKPFSSTHISTRKDMLPGPVTTFDGGPNQESGTLSTYLLRQFPHVLLIECMLEKMCASYETDPAKQKELFNTLRTYFVSFRLLPPHEGFPQMDGVRLRVCADLNNLFRLAKLQISSKCSPSPVVGPLAVVSSPSGGTIYGSSDANEHLFSSRYETDFKELEFIAAGGFGVVYKARNILDNNEYAIKKIVIRPKSANKIIREVQLLSLLHHPNVVAYKSAWLEYTSPQTLHDVIQRMEGMSLSSQDGSSVVNKVSFYSREYETVVRRTVESNTSDGVVFESESVSETRSSSHTSYHHEESKMTMSTEGQLAHEKKHRWRLSLNQIVSSPALLLYIQMQLCSQTLRQWMNERNGKANSSSSCLTSIEPELSIFRQIVKGVKYIHSNNIIHRDIKPENIFINSTTQQVQIGDFGLAKLGFTSSEVDGHVLAAPVPVMAHRNTKGVGTHSYAAPEQLNSQESDAKSDIYSLGVVLVELLIPFRTDMERYKSIEWLRNRQRLPETLHKQWPQIAELIVEMISHDRGSRPSAAEILDRLDRVGEDRTRGGMSNEAVPEDQPTVLELLAIIEDLRRQVAEKNQLIERLIKEQRPT